MITVKEIESRTMTPEKRESAKNDLFAFYIAKPISYVLTIPFLYTNITPNEVSLTSVLFVLIGTLLMYIGNSKITLVAGWFMFFLWLIFDCIDGNIARYKKQFSPLGSVYDAMSGYAAMALSFLSWGIAASHNPGIFQECIGLPSDLYIVLGALSGFFAIFPRLIMHKKLTTVRNDKKAEDIKDKSNYGFCKIIALNLVSISGLVQIFMLISVLANMMDLFTCIYFVLNFIVMMVSLWLLLRI